MSRDKIEHRCNVLANSVKKPLFLCCREVQNTLRTIFLYAKCVMPFLKFYNLAVVFIGALCVVVSKLALCHVLHAFFKRRRCSTLYYGKLWLVENSWSSRMLPPLSLATTCLHSPLALISISIRCDTNRTFCATLCLIFHNSLSSSIV